MNENSEHNKSIRFGVAPINWNNDDIPELGSDYTIETILSEMNQASMRSHARPSPTGQLPV